MTMTTPQTDPHKLAPQADRESLGANGRRRDPAIRSPRIPSNRMPAPPAASWSWRTLLGVATAAALIFALLAFWPIPVASLIVVIAALSAVSGYRSRRALARLAAARPGESICSFARAFDCRNVDTWVIRAVYESVQDYLQGDFGRFPLRAEDDLFRTLKIDAEDLELDLLPAMASRCRRRLAPGAHVPAATVGDLVLFLDRLEAL
jgi:hypothetical protein